MKNVTFGYDEHVVLDRLSFQVLDGDQVTLAGRTGAGKSTIMRAAPWSLQTTEGQCHDPRRSLLRNQGKRPAELLRLCGAVLPHGAGNRPGSDHPL